MNRQDFDDLIRTLEARHDGRPSALERSARRWVALGRVSALAWVGLNFALGAAAFAAGAMLGGPGAFLLAVGVALVVYGMIQTGLILIVDAPEEEVIELKRPFPDGLASVLESLRAEIGCRRFDEVRVSNEFNATIREVPRLGLFGWPRTSLEIGLPLAMALSPDEMKAVLAHEFAHISARHGRSGNRLYQLHRTWDFVFQKLQEPSAGRALRAMRWAVSKYIGWYWPRLRARTLLLSRAHEYQADRIAGSIVGPATMASSLWRIECVDPRLFEKFWPDLHMQANRLPEPPDDLFPRLRAAIAAGPSPEDATRWADRSLARATVNEYSHPAFPDRVRGLHLDPESFRTLGNPDPSSLSAAETLFAGRLEAIERELADLWKHKVAAGWRLRHRRALAEGKKAGMLATSSPDFVSVEALWASARETSERLGPEAAEPQLREVLARDPTHPGAGVILGHHLLDRGDPQGERLLLQVADLDDEEWMPQAVAILHAYYHRNGQAGRLREMRIRLDRHEADLSAAHRERSNVSARDSFSAHGLDDAQLAPLLAVLGSMPECEAAWLARKDLKHFPARPLFILAVRIRGSRLDLSIGDREQALVRKLVPRVELPGQFLVVSRRSPFGKIAAKIMKRKGSAIHASR